MYILTNYMTIGIHRKDTESVNSRMRELFHFFACFFFFQTVVRLEQEEDINQIKDYFSYEHFYVIYCKFWELDKDHDLFIDREDLSRYNDHGRCT